jgi:hypothetical protein
MLELLAQKAKQSKLIMKSSSQSKNSISMNLDKQVMEDQIKDRLRETLRRLMAEKMENEEDTNMHNKKGKCAHAHLHWDHKDQDEFVEKIAKCKKNRSLLKRTLQEIGARIIFIE